MKAFAGGSEFPFVILSATLPGSPKITLPTFRGDAVTHYWLLPITAAERELAEKVGSAQLLDELERNDVDFIIRPREPVIDTPDSSA